jgi:hypothetical protein
MKLADHVDSLRELIEAAFDKQFARLGFGKTKQMDAQKVEGLPEDVKAKRERFVTMLENHIGETGCYDSAREKLVDELTFTLFNRLAAIKVMEAASLFPPILTKQSEHGDRSFGHKAWLEMNPHMRNEELEGIRDYLKIAFDELGQTLPLYSKSYPYALLPDAVSLNDIVDAFNAVEKDDQINNAHKEGIWQSDDVLGWMYESYNNKKKQAHKDSKAKTEYNKVSLQSQVYTPRWVVQFLVDNSLGKMYLEMYPQSEIKQRFKIANAPTTQTRTPKPLHEVRTIDPACGSGNFLLYAFDFYYELYLDQIENYDAGYEEKDIPKLIIENNLHGIDLDDRAVQLAQLGLFIKAKKKRRAIGELNFRVVSSDFYLPEYNEVRHIFEQGTGIERNQQELIEKIWNDLQYAYKFGSLVHVDEQLNKQLHAIEGRAENDLFAKADLTEHKDFSVNFFSNLTTAVEQYARTGRNTFLTSKARDAIIFLELLTTEYDVATANPPYTDSSDFGPDLKEFIEENYKKPFKFHTNLYSSFLKRCCELTSAEGMIGMIHPNTFMFIKTFEGVRNFILKNYKMDILVDYGLDRVNLFGGGILLDSNSFYVLSKKKKNENGIYFNIDLNQQEKFKKTSFIDALEDVIQGTENKRVFHLNQSKFKIIRSSPFIYWISDDFREKFKQKTIESICPPKSGMATANNNRFLRFWWEVSPNQLSDEVGDDKHWVKYSKGGPFQKWAGNLWLRISWEDSAQVLRDTGRAVFRNEEYYFRKGITYSASGQKGASFRYLPENSVYDVGGASLFPIKNDDILFSLAILNSKLACYVIACLNPTVNTQVGDIERIPFAETTIQSKQELDLLVDSNINITKHIMRQTIVEDEFEASPLLNNTSEKISKTVKKFFDRENSLVSQVLLNEAVINDKIFNIYSLTANDRAMVLAKEGENVGGLPVVSEARDAYLAEAEATKEFPFETIRDFIDTLPSKEFSDEEREIIEGGFSSLYQNNNNLEEFCIHHQINPINVWYWFKQSKVIPKQRMQTLAMELLTDMTREILMEDEDGIIPLVPNAGEKVLLDRIEEKFLEKSFSLAQYSSFDSVLGRPVHEYMNKHFFAELSDHLNLFMYLPKTPFIWHLTSGPEQGFDCYIIIYKWSRDNLLRLRSVYIENRERALQNRESDIAGNESAEAQNEKERIFKQLKEIDAFKKKIDELLAEGYNPVLDDGVGKNIAPLQNKKMLPYDVLNAGQLKKYLKADW